MAVQLDTNQQLDYAASIQRVAQSIIEQHPATAIYNNNTLGIQSQSLAANFCVTHQLLGESPFTALSQVYSQYFPATHWDINLYGDQFAEFIASQVHSAQATTLPWLTIAAIASIEYGIVHAYYAENNSKQQGYQELPGRPEAQFSEEAYKLLVIHYPYCSFPNQWLPSQPIAIWREGIEIKVYQKQYSLHKAEVINGK